MRNRMKVVERFVRKVRVSDRTGCWIWAGAKSGSGYGNFVVDGKNNGAHRHAWEFFRGPIPEGHELDHVVCATKLCVNPDHLEPVPVEGRENTRRYQATKTHCVNGHPKTPENRYAAPGATKSSCRLCRAERQREMRRRKAASRAGGDILVDRDTEAVPA